MFQLNGTRMYSLVLYKKTFLYSSPNYHLISLLDIISKHYVNLVLISLVFWSQYSIVILNYTVQLSITLRKMFQEPQIYTLISEKRSFMTLSRLYLILIPGNRQVLSMDSTWLSHWNYFYDIINRFFFFIFFKNNYICFMIQNSGSIINLYTRLGIDLFSKENSRSEL